MGGLVFFFLDMKLIEYRIPMPVSCDEYKIGQLYAVSKSSNQETSGDSGVEVLVNEPYDKDGKKGQYTHKIYHLGSKIPGWLAALAPASALKIDEKAWNGFPHIKTELTNPFMGDRFTYTVETMHKDNDTGEEENILELEKSQLKQRVIKRVDIIDPVPDSEDPTKFKSEKTGRGPLEKDWQKTSNPVMCAYKLVTIDFRYFGLQNRVENLILSYQDNIFAKFHQQVFCWLDEWYGMSIDDIRAYEVKLAEEMNSKLDAPEGKE